jgi:hypothetical protein
MAGKTTENFYAWLWSRQTETTQHEGLCGNAPRGPFAFQEGQLPRYSEEGISRRQRHQDLTAMLASYEAQLHAGPRWPPTLAACVIQAGEQKTQLTPEEKRDRHQRRVAIAAAVREGKADVVADAFRVQRKHARTTRFPSTTLNLTRTWFIDIGKMISGYTPLRISILVDVLHRNRTLDEVAQKHAMSTYMVQQHLNLIADSLWMRVRESGHSFTYHEERRAA